MNINIKTIFLVATVFAFSCDPDLVDEPSATQTEETYFNMDVAFRSATASAYSVLYDYYHYATPNFAPAIEGDHWVAGTWLLPGDDLTESMGFRPSVELFDGSLNPANRQLEYVFGSSYKLIARANVVIDKTRNVDYSTFKNVEEIAIMEGEGLFLRAYAYWNLYNIFGSVPIIHERFQPDDDTNTPKSPALEVLNKVIDDSRLALGILPEFWEESYAGRATKNSARGLLARALVFRANHTGDNADYSEALNIFNSITADLEDDFVNNFNAFTENNGESLFEVQASVATANFNNMLLHNDGAWRGVENMSVYRGFMMQASDPGDFNINASTRFLVTEKLLNGFGDDPRIQVFLNPNDGLDGRIFQKYNLPEGVNEIIERGGGGSLNNERVLRYADLVLIAAEAELKTGNPAIAIEYVNDIRTRAREWGLAAGLSDGTMPADHPTGETNQATIMKWIMDERYVELAGEGHRFWDLKRWHTAGDMDLSGWDGSDTGFSTALASPVQFDVNTNLVFPLPQKEMERNGALTENNPGY